MLMDKVKDAATAAGASAQTVSDPYTHMIYHICI